MNNLNPLTIIDDLLGDYVSPKYRRLIHAAVLFIAFVVMIWQASDQDWKKALVALGAALYAAANKANTLPLNPAGHDDGEDDGLSYEEAGGLPFPEEHSEDLS
jgi:hypothetical protein